VFKAMPSRHLSALITIGAAIPLLVLTWPQLVGAQNSWVIAHIVSFRGLAVLSAAALLPLLLLSRAEALRRVTGLLAAVVMLFVIANAGILLVRGVGHAGQASAGARTGAVTVLSWNTLGDAPGAAEIARLALARGADIVTLAETTESTGVAVAKAMRAGGRPMWVHTIAFDHVSKARSTTLLISPSLGRYEVDSTAGSGPPGNTNVLPTVVARPVDGTGPTVIAVHAVAPVRFEMSNWRSDLDWLATQCTGNVIMAGDFNATLDHMAGRAASASAVLGECGDAALATGSGAVGSWPTWAPALLGTPIDHVLSSPNWQVESMVVIGSEDSAGSDHRPIVAELSPAG
jgi:endonuclease/exonuclease/phosphatase (EEP) superfamily protein YafD